MDETVRKDIEDCLSSCRAASLATVDADGSPHAANVWYVHDADWRLYFVSSPATAHAQHIAAGSAPGRVVGNARRTTRVAVTIHDHCSDPTQIHGLQFHGLARALKRGTPRAAAALELYSAKYPFVLTGSFAELLALQRFYEVTPTWLRWIDNRRGFGFRVEKQLPAHPLR